MRKLLSIEQLKVVRELLYWTLLIVPVSIVVGSLVALFLWLLQVATDFRWQHLYIIYLLPLAGIVITFLYKAYGKNVEAGNNLVMEEIHKPGGGVPVRMTPLVLFTTIITHLFGGSAGREGTAVQMGGSIASLFAKWYRLQTADRKIILMSGMAAGFGAVFGTPVTGAVFAMEVLAIGTIQYSALLPCLIASVLADVTCTAWGIEHTHYHISLATGTATVLFQFNVVLLLKVILSGVCFGLAGYIFARLLHIIKNVAIRYVKNQWLIPVVGGAAVIAISLLLNNVDYLGLGVTNPNQGVSIVSAFSAGGAEYYSWFLKLLLTAITLATGFKGGEVTPLFFIGATLGNTLAMLGGAPVDLFAGLGFIAVFAAATNTPLACTLMGVELFGGDHVLYYAVACFTAYYFSGHTGIYSAQKIAIHKVVR